MSEIDKTKFCPDCGQSLEYLGGDGLIERSGQCEVCAGESERDRLNADRARERLTSNAWATQVATLAAERDEARDALHRRGMSVSPDLDIMRLHTQRDSARAEVAALQADLEARMTQLNEARAATVDANMALADANERAAAANERADANLRLRMDVLATYVSKEQDRCVAAAEAEAKRWREEGCGDERHEFAGHGIDDAVKAMRKRD